MPLTLLLTGFGPFPGAPVNPTTPLVRRLATLRRPALAEVTRVAHVFATSYQSVDRELPALLKRHRPDVLLMFGVATRAKTLRVERVARNARALLFSDVAGHRPLTAAISKGGPATLPGRAPFVRLVSAARVARVPVAPSRNAGRYLCNYAYWRGIAAAQNAPRLVAFVHVPALTRKSRHRLTFADFVRGGEAVMREMVSEARRET